MIVIDISNADILLRFHSDSLQILIKLFCDITRNNILIVKQYRS